MYFTRRRSTPSRRRSARAAGVGAVAAALVVGVAAARSSAAGDGVSGGDGGGAAPGAAHDAATIRYDRDVRPLLSDRCFKCHGRDESKRKAKLRLDDAASAGAATRQAPGTISRPAENDAPCGASWSASIHWK